MDLDDNHYSDNIQYLKSDTIFHVWTDNVDETKPD
jgi:hypothetical protein